MSDKVYMVVQARIIVRKDEDAQIGDVVSELRVVSDGHTCDVTDCTIIDYEVEDAK